MNHKHTHWGVLAGVSLAVALAAAPAQAVTFSGSAPTAAGVQPVVDAFRSALGTLNANVVGSFGSGRREINWDGVPDALASPNAFPAGFFNSNSPRGVVFATPGAGFEVSANAASGTAVRFGNIDPLYSTFFATFSPQRLFTPRTSTTTDVSFFVPGTNIPALTNGFGSIFTDVDLANTSSLEFFDAGNSSLGTFFVPAIGGDQTLSFLGVTFPTANVSRVRITSGSAVLQPNDGTGPGDLVVMDDFVFGEPVAAGVPEPLSAGLGLMGLASVALALLRRRGAAPPRLPAAF